MTTRNLPVTVVSDTVEIQTSNLLNTIEKNYILNQFSLLHYAVSWLHVFSFLPATPPKQRRDTRVLILIPISIDYTFASKDDSRWALR